MADAYIEIQENLFDYFEDVDNKTFTNFVDMFVYHNGTQDTETCKFCEKFLNDNGLVQAYLNYMHDRDNPQKFFRRSHMSQTSMIDQIKSALLSIAYNRFRRELSKPKAKPFSKLNRDEKDDLKMVIGSCERHNNDFIEDEDTTRSMFDEEEANDIIAERKRLSKLFTKVLKMLK